MKTRMTILLTGIIVLFSLTSCRDRGVVEGGLYYTPGEHDGYSVLKVLKVDPEGVHVRLYSNHYSQPPTKIDESKLYMAGQDRKPDEGLGMGHVPLSKKTFLAWNARFIQQSTVTEAELEGYKIWLEAKGGYF
jgi:hypothetical protein